MTIVRETFATSRTFIVSRLQMDVSHMAFARFQVLIIKRTQLAAEFPIGQHHNVMVSNLEKKMRKVM